GGAEFENLVTTDTATVTVNDTIDSTVVTLGQATYVEGTAGATITATINNAPKDAPLVLTLSNGATITFAVGATSATSTAFAVPVTTHGAPGSATDAAITQTITATVTSGGAEFESLSVSNGSLTIIDQTPSITVANDANSDGMVTVAAPNTATTYNTQLVDWKMGADGYGSYSVSNTTGVVALSSQSSGQVVIDLKYQDAVVGTLTLNADGTDSIQVFNRPTTLVTDELLTSDVTASGPSLTKYINSSIGGLNITVTGSDGNSTPNQSSDEVNPSTQGWAVSDNQIDRNEAIKFSFNQSVDQFSFRTTGFTGSPSNNQVGLKIIVTYEGGVKETFYVNSTQNGTIKVQELTGFGEMINGNYVTKFESVEVISNTEAGKGIDVQDHNDGFRLNNVTVGQYREIDPTDLNFKFTLNATDADGDTVSQNFNVTLNGSSSGSLVVEATAGTAGDDTLSGTSGNNVLIGGPGNDTMTGGLGADVFKWTLGDQGTSSTPAVDHVTDFSKVQGDSLDLRDLLQGESDATLSQYLTFGEEGGKAVLNVSTTAGGDVTQKIVFDNMSLAQLQTAYEADSAVDLIAKMRAAGGLSTDN
ncbi:type I secretion C-terminal target domain-containing protein, partial [Hydrogenophaga aquatica]